MWGKSVPWGWEVGGGECFWGAVGSPPPPSHLQALFIPCPPHPSSSFPRSPAGAEGFVRSPTIFSAFGDHVGWKGIKGLRQLGGGGFDTGLSMAAGTGGSVAPHVCTVRGCRGLGCSLLFWRCCLKGTLGTLGMQGGGGGTGCPQVSPDVPQQHVASGDSGCGYGGVMGCTVCLGMWG